MKRALFSVTDKTGIATLAQGLRELFPQLEILASGGTAAELDKEGIPHTCISSVTQFPECFGGRVKTLHPALLGGILYRRGVDDAEAKRLKIEPIDLVVCNLYAFDSKKSKEELAASMDIGGSSMIRAACKNYASVAVLIDPKDYAPFLTELKQGPLSLKTREELAGKALRMSAAYEARLADAFTGSSTLQLVQERKLSYGENPDQEGWVYSFPDEEGVASAKILGEKPLSYNNYEDASQAFYALQRVEGIGVAIVKHGSLCGLATGKTLRQAFQRAWEGDTKSAYGSIIAFSQEVGEELCEELKSRFVEVLLAPSFSPAFLAWAARAKPSLRLLQVDLKAVSERHYRSISGGMLIQTAKKGLFSALEKHFQPLHGGKVGVATKRQPRPEQAGLYRFAIAAVQSVKSNAIVLVREYEPSLYQMIGAGGGQPNRVDSLQRLALPKAIENLEREGGDLKQKLQELVLASDGFFPFADSVEAASELGIETYLQPGGSVRDEEVIQEADKRGLCMMFTGQRYFNH